MLGYSISFASFAIVECMTSPKFHIKFIGYLAASQCFDKETEVAVLVVNLVKKVSFPPLFISAKAYLTLFDYVGSSYSSNTDLLFLSELHGCRSPHFDPFLRFPPPYSSSCTRSSSRYLITTITLSTYRPQTDRLASMENTEKLAGSKRTFFRAGRERGRSLGGASEGETGRRRYGSSRSDSQCRLRGCEERSETVSFARS